MVRNDPNNLRYFLEELNERQQKWVSKIHSYDFNIEYVNYKTNNLGDALSRRTIPTYVLQLKFWLIENLNS